LKIVFPDSILLLQYMAKASKCSQALIYDQKIHISKNVVQNVWCWYSECVLL